MSMARLVVTAVRVQGRPVAEVAREYSVSRRWLHELLRRYDADGEAGLEARSRRPRSCPARTPTAIEDRIVALRKGLADHGLDAGAATIQAHLLAESDAAPSVPTIWRILSRRGFVVPQPHKRPRSSWRRFQAEQPNELWQADITHWALADGTGVEILNILDDHSRLLTGSTARTVFKAADVLAGFADAFTRNGFPAAVLTDNGAVFTATPRHGQCLLQAELTRLGIDHKNSRPYHPQTCGKVERFHQTLKKWLTQQPPAPTAAELTAQLDTFGDYYNTRRPHRACGRRPPITAYTARPQAGPARPVEIPAHIRVRRDKIDPSGVITLRHRSRLHHIGLGRAHAGTRVLVLADGLDIRVLTQDGELLRQLTLDPSRDYQPQAKT